MGKAIINGNEIFGNVHIGEGGDVANPNIADVYDPTQTYNTGDRRIYNDVLYVCNDDNVTGAWDSTKWDSATIDEIISALTAADIPYSSGVSVADKLDNVPTFDTLTTSDNNKLLGVSVSGSDISVGAVAPIIDVDGSTICVSHISNIYTVSLKNCTIANAYIHLAPYTTSKILRFVTWNTTNTHPVMVNMGENTVTLIDCTTWQIIPNTNTDTIHGSATYIKI